MKILWIACILGLITHGFFLAKNHGITFSKTTFLHFQNDSLEFNKIKLPQTYISKTKEFIKAQNLNTKYCLMINFKIHSGRERMFLYDLQQNKTIKKFVVTHGVGKMNQNTNGIANEFSNLDNSHCSSLGFYKIGIRDYSSWGIHVKYILHGLNTSNSNAEQRNVVLHSWDKVTTKEIYPFPTAMSWGCPAVSNSNMRYLDSFIQKQSEPLLLYMFK